MSEPSPPSGRRYGEKEIGRLLKRATELQHSEPTAPAAGGMTLNELEEIATEAGIDPRFLRRAARELDAGHTDDSPWVKIVGDELMLVRETRVPGELGAEGFERVVATIQRSSRLHGQPSLLGKSLTWRAETPGKSRTLQITVVSSRGHTDVRIEESLHQFAGGLFGGTVAGVGAGVGLGAGLPLAIEVFGSAVLAVAFPLGVIGLTTIATREIYRAVVRSRRRRVAELFEAVVAEVTASVSAGDVEPPAPKRELPAG